MAFLLMWKFDCTVKKVFKKSQPLSNFNLLRKYEKYLKHKCDIARVKEERIFNSQTSHENYINMYVES